MGRLSPWLLVLAGCYHPSVQAGAPCVDDGDCPSALRCVERTCGGTGSDLDAAIDGPALLVDASPDAPPPQMVRFTINQPNQIRDTWLWSDRPNDALGLDVQGSVDAEVLESCIFRFDLGAIPTNATVVAATFGIRTDDTSDPGGGTVRAYVMLQSWVETEATFASRSAGQAWSTPGARPPSRATTVIGTLAPLAVQTNYTMTLTPAAVQGWVTQPATNFGFILVRGTSNEHLHFHMKESNFKPSLVVDVLVPK